MPGRGIALTFAVTLNCTCAYSIAKLVFHKCPRVYTKEVGVKTQQFKREEDINNQLETEFYNFLVQKAEEYGFSESKKADWVGYMADLSRGESTVEAVLSELKFTTQKSDSVLDVGCGFGGLLMALQQHFEHTAGAEILAERVEWAKKRASQAEVVCCNASQLPWADESFTVVFATDVMEHMPYDDQAIVASELMRVLKPGGYGFISVPNRFQIRDEHNSVLLGTWLPDVIREKYATLASGNRQYERCWERTGRNWQRLFEAQGFQVMLKSLKPKSIRFLPASRYHLYLTKPSVSG